MTSSVLLLRASQTHEIAMNIRINNTKAKLSVTHCLYLYIIMTDSVHENMQKLLQFCTVGIVWNFELTGNAPHLIAHQNQQLSHLIDVNIQHLHCYPPVLHRIQKSLVLMQT